MGAFLVTGANGFVGSALCKTLRKNNIEVVAVTRTLIQDGDVCMGNLSGSTDWKPALKGCDVVIHVAGRVHVMNDVSQDPLAAFRAVNVEATLNLARQAGEAGVRRLVYVSSAKVNGESTTDQAFSAADRPSPADPYAISKYEAEQGLLALARHGGPDVVIVRPPLIYGPGVRANFQRLMRLVHSGLPLPLAAIHNRRSMVALDNLVDLLMVCATHPAAAGQVVMASDGHDVSTSELLGMVAKAMHKRSMLFPVPATLLASLAAMVGKSSEATRLLGSLQVDISLTKSLLGWHPVVSVQAAIDKTVAHFLAHHPLAKQ